MNWNRSIGRLLPLASLVVLAVGCESVTPTDQAIPEPSFSNQSSDLIPGQYLVVLRAGENARDVASAGGVAPHHVYSRVLNGFAVRMSDEARDRLQADPRVLRVVQDKVVRASALNMFGSGTQPGATWGLDRIDQRALPLSTSYSWGTSGAGVTAYVIDTGIRITHSDFGGQASHGFDFIDNDPIADDCNGHGTHVSGTVGGTTWGVAKDVNLVAVRVLDCAGFGSFTQVIAGVDWVTANAVFPAVANMSLGGSSFPDLDAAVEASIAAGITYSIAAGNSAIDACTQSPAKAPNALTMGATDNADKRAWFSNIGACVDWFAPGVAITSAWNTNDAATKTIDGTSMAAPHNAGVVALFLESNPLATPAVVRTALFDLLTKDIVTDARSTNDHLLFSLTGEGTVNLPPVSAFTFACTGLACNFTDASTDSDGTISARSWTFGDGGTSTATNPSHTYSAAGTFTVTLTVTDNDGANGVSSQNVTVTAGGITLTAVGRLQGGTRHVVDLSWSGATGTNIDFYRNGVKIGTTANDGAHSDRIGATGPATYRYRVCNAGVTTGCSTTATVVF